MRNFQKLKKIDIYIYRINEHVTLGKKRKHNVSNFADHLGEDNHSFSTKSF